MLINIFGNRKLWLAIALLFLLTIGYFYKNNAFSFSFVDEEYNFAIGKYLLRNEILYKDIVTNHQPITHILSSQIQKYTNPNSIFLLVSRHREFIVLWSIVWSLFFVFYFGLSALLFIFLYELTKSYLFGNLFLAEAVVVYPLLFLIGLVIYDKRNLNNFELFFAGICIALSMLLLGPVWPVIGCLILWLLYRHKHSMAKNCLYLTLGIFMIILLIWRYTSFLGYLHYYLYENLTYTIPSYHSAYYHESWFLTILKAFIAPILSFARSDTTPTTYVIRVLSLLTIINLLFLIHKKKFTIVLTIIILLGMSNIRFVPPGTEHYQGFHLLPWYSALIFISSVVSVEHLKQNGHAVLKTMNIILIIFAVTLGFKYVQPVLLAKRYIQKNYLINYSTHTDRGEIIKIIRHPNDTLFISSDAWLIYWQSDTNHLPKLFGYYAWMAGNPDLHSAILEAFAKNPPTFFYCNNCKGLDLEKFLGQYSEVKKNKGGTNLYVLPSRIQTLTKSQLDQLKFYDVSFNDEKDFN